MKVDFRGKKSIHLKGCGSIFVDDVMILIVDNL